MRRFTRVSSNSISLFALSAAAVWLLWSATPPILAKSGAAATATPSVSQRVTNLELALLDAMEQINELKGIVENQAALLEFVHREDGDINGLAGPHVIFEGCNVHVRNATGQTFEIDGAGNLIVGYNETPGTRTGSHNLVVGPAHTYTSHSGFVVGSSNNVTAPYATVSGGYGNTASAGFATVSGGALNEAMGLYASVSGGEQNTSSGQYGNVIGGFDNEAGGNASVVVGGILNDASASTAVVVGGTENTASGLRAVVVGGSGNTASGTNEIAP